MRAEHQFYCRCTQWKLIGLFIGNLPLLSSKCWLMLHRLHTQLLSLKDQIVMRVFPSTYTWLSFGQLLPVFPLSLWKVFHFFDFYLQLYILPPLQPALHTRPHDIPANISSAEPSALWRPHCFQRRRSVNIICIFLEGRAVKIIKCYEVRCHSTHCGEIPKHPQWAPFLHFGASFQCVFSLICRINQLAQVGILTDWSRNSCPP